MVSNHTLAVNDFNELASGHGSAQVMAKLADAQFSKRLLCLRLLMNTVQDVATQDESGFCSAYDLLAKVQEKDSNAVSRVLMYPSVGVWSLSCLRALRSGGRTDSFTARPDYLGAIAAAAAIRAGLEFEITVPVRAGSIMLPTLGKVQFDDRRDDNLAVLRGGDGRIEASVGRRTIVIETSADGRSDGGGWSQLHHLAAKTAGHSLGVFLDDLDPYRIDFGLPISSRLPPGEVDAWRRKLDQAWAMLVHHHLTYATAMEVGLVSLVPLESQTSSKGMSATSSEAFGACALSAPADEQTLALTLVHEFQHAKLGSLHDLVALHDATSDILYYSPWREDPRPLHGILHGAYAHLAVTEFWRAQCRHAPMDRFSQFGFARSREQTLEALTTVQQSGKLTEIGVCFVQGMRAQLDRYGDDVVPDEPAWAAKVAIADHQVGWRIRNLLPDRALVDRLATAWLAGGTAEPSKTQFAIVGPRCTVQDNAQVALGYRRLTGPATLKSDLDAEPNTASSLDDDAALVEERLAATAKAYGGVIMADPDRLDAWVGLTLTQRRVAPSALPGRPELAYAVYLRIRAISDIIPEPLGVANWLFNGTEARDASADRGCSSAHSCGGSMSNS